MYLGISTSFSPVQRGAPYMENEKLFGHYFKGDVFSAILINDFTTGFIIKTYYQQYKLVHAFKHPEFITIRTSKAFWLKNKKNLGMSLFRKVADNDFQSSLILPPGSLYVNDHSFGTWVMSNYGEKRWKFHTAYQDFPQKFGWDNFDFTLRAYKTMKIHIENNAPFYGLNQDFGTYGDVTKAFLQTEYEEVENEFVLLDHLKKYFTFNFKEPKSNE